jgi:tripartite-type tricarboxylate transporter receptor subunit TctC
MISRRNIMIGIGALAFTDNANSQSLARASELTFVVPASPGGSADISGRLLAREISSIRSLPIIVTNRSAGQGIEGTLHVFNSSSDSGNVLVGGPNGLFFAPARENLPYNVDSFEPVCMFSAASFVLVSRTDRFQNINELISAMQSRRVNFAFSAADGRYLIERMSASLNAKDTVAVSYRGGGDAVRDVHSGVVDVAITSLASVIGLVQSGSLNLLAHTLDHGNIDVYPNVPRLSNILNSTDPALTTFHWHGLYMPKGSSQSVIQALQDASKIICTSQSFINNHVERGMTSRYMDSIQLREHHIRMNEYMVGYNNWLKGITVR